MSAETQEEGLFEVAGPRDRPFNPHRAPRSAGGRALAAEVLDALLQYEASQGLRKRKRRAEDQTTLAAIVTAVVADLTHRAVSVPEGWVAVPLSKRVLGQGGRYGSPVLSKTLPHVLACLAAPGLEYVELNKGRINPFARTNFQSTMRAGWRLRARINHWGVQLDELGIEKGQELIILKRAKQGHWDDGEWVEYPDTAATRRYRAEMTRINAWLAQADIHFEGTFCKGRPPEADETDRTLRRYFNNSSFEQGGRLFGGFWQALRKAERAAGLLIDEEAVVTLDYAQMAPRVLYGLARATPPEGDAYALPGYGREGVKKLFNALRFTDKPIERFPKGVRELFPKYAAVNQVIELLRQKHQPIAHLFCTGIGHRDMFIESQILVDVLLRLIDQAITALPVHDAVIVPRSKRHLAKDVMLTVFQAHTGVTGAVEEEQPR